MKEKRKNSVYCSADKAYWLLSTIKHTLVYSCNSVEEKSVSRNVTNGTKISKLSEFCPYSSKRCLNFMLYLVSSIRFLINHFLIKKRSISIRNDNSSFLTLIAS